jgi:hypothetical protein
MTSVATELRFAILMGGGRRREQGALTRDD